MAKSWYQIEKINGNSGKSEGYDVISSTSAKQSLTDYLTNQGCSINSESEPVIIGQEKINGEIVNIARCPTYTAEYWTSKKIKR